MNHLKLLIVDDVEDNRLVLQAISRRLKRFDIREACDGIEAVDVAEAWRPDIILMDITMPRMDGLEASRIIKERFPETIIMAVTAVMDPQMEKNMASIGVSAYIRKPIDKELIHFKLKSFAGLIEGYGGHRQPLTAKEAINPFTPDVRHFKTTFAIPNEEGMMDFGIWMLSRSENFREPTCAKADTIIELFYEAMRQTSRRTKEPLEIVVEESFEEMFISLRFISSIVLSPHAAALIKEFGEECIQENTQIHIRLGLQEGYLAPAKTASASAELPQKPSPERFDAAEAATALSESQAPKEVRVIGGDEHAILRHSYTDKTTAADYIRDIGGDVLDEILDLASLDSEWSYALAKIQETPSVESIDDFATRALGAYVHAINGLFEFTALAYALSALSGSLREHAQKIVADPALLGKLVILLEHLGLDLGSWRGHLFEQQDAQDIHYLDSSFFSSCMQIEGIVSDKQVSAADDDNDMEFF